MLNQDAVDLRTRVEPLNLRAELGLSDGLVEVNVLRVEASRRACFVLLADVSDAGRIVADQYRREPGTYSFAADSTFTDMGTSGVCEAQTRGRDVAAPRRSVPPRASVTATVGRVAGQCSTCKLD